MVVNTVNELIELLNQVDFDASVLSSIANDSATTTTSGSGPGLVTTRLGANVKNVQKVIADIENGITTGVRADIQQDGSNVVESAGTINFIGTQVEVTDVSGVATVEITPDVAKAGTPALNQVAVWVSEDAIEGVSDFTWNGNNLQLESTDPTITIYDTDAANGAIATISAGAAGNLIVSADPNDDDTSTDISFLVDNTEILNLRSEGPIITGTGGFGGSDINYRVKLNDNANFDMPGLMFIDEFDSIISRWYVYFDEANEVSPAILGGVRNNFYFYGEDNLNNRLARFETLSGDVFTIDESGNADFTGNVVSRFSIPSVISSRTLALTDESEMLEIDTSGGAVTLTIPLTASVDFPVGTKIQVTLVDASNAATIAGDVGVTLNGVSGGSGDITATAWSSITLYKRNAVDEWVVFGDIGTVS